MPDWKVTLSRVALVNGERKTLETDFVVDGTSRDLALPVGMDEIFKRETASGNALVPKEACDYWTKWRVTGGLMYEFLSELENNWGCSLGIQQVIDDAAIVVEPTHQRIRNGLVKKAGDTVRYDELPDLNSMLQNHLKLLQDRNTILGEELKRKQAEFDRNNTDIMRISTMMTTAQNLIEPPVLPPIERPLFTGSIGISDSVVVHDYKRKKRGRPPKAAHANG